MKTRLLISALALALVASPVDASPWTYRGALSDGGVPANGRYDIRLTIQDASGVKSIAAPVTFNGVEVIQGQFSVDVDFGVDLMQFDSLKLKAEVAQGGSAFANLGEAKTIDPKALLGSVCWDTAGNAGTNAATDFIGTTDNQPVILRAKNKQVASFAAPDGVGATRIAMGATTNIASATGATVSGGGNDFGGNLVTNIYGTIGGGSSNRVGGISGVIGGGNGNIVSGNDAVVSGGASNCAGGDGSWAGGDNARVRSGNEVGDIPCQFPPNSGDANGDEGSFVWADSSGPMVSSGPNQFLVRASGGVGINGNPESDGLEFNVFGATPFDGFVEFSLIPNPSLNGNTGERVELGVGKGGTGANDANLRIAHRNGSGAFFEHLSINGDGSVVVRSNPANTAQGVQLAVGAGGWSLLSDRSLKTDIIGIDPRHVLDRLIAMPVSQWRYIGQPGQVQHIGPMAQDFAAAFGVGENDTTISTIDANGVALAAIQGLNTKLEAENAALKSKLASLDERLAALEATKEH